jgi:hypothetical protein
VADILLRGAKEVEEMTSRVALVAAVSAFAVFLSGPAPVHGQQQPPSDTQHEQHHPGTTAEQPSATTSQPQANMTAMMSRMKANDAKLSELVTKMNAATGSAKTDAMAQLLTALVEDRRNACEPMMTNMMSMMQMMGGQGMHAPASSAPKK